MWGNLTEIVWVDVVNQVVAAFQYKVYRPSSHLFWERDEMLPQNPELTPFLLFLWPGEELH